MTLSPLSSLTRSLLDRIGLGKEPVGVHMGPAPLDALAAPVTQPGMAALTSGIALAVDASRPVRLGPAAAWGFPVLPGEGQSLVCQNLSLYLTGEPLLVCCAVRVEGLCVLLGLLDEPSLACRIPAGNGAFLADLAPLLSQASAAPLLLGLHASDREHLKVDELLLAVPTALWWRMLERAPAAMDGLSFERVEASMRKWGESRCACKAETAGRSGFSRHRV